VHCTLTLHTRRRWTPARPGKGPRHTSAFDQARSLVRGLVTVSRPVGGVLSAPRGVVTIHLSGLPGDCPFARAGGPPESHVWPCSGWGLPSRPGHPGRWCALTAPFHPRLCGPEPAIGSLLSVALSFGSPRLAVSQHPALWSPDLPRPDSCSRRPGPRSPGRLTVASQCGRSGMGRDRLPGAVGDQPLDRVSDHGARDRSAPA